MKVSKKASSRPTKDNGISPRLIDAVKKGIAGNLRVRRTLPLRGRIHVDRQLPFLCVYRRPKVELGDGIKRLVTSEASHLFATGLRGFYPGLEQLVHGVVGTLAPEFGRVLVVEISELHGEPTEAAGAVPRPAFRVLVPRDERWDDLAAAFESGLRSVEVLGRAATISVRRTDRVAPPGLSGFFTRAEAEALGCVPIGIEVKPIYRNPKGGVYPQVFREFEREFTRALRQILFVFSGKYTTHRPKHYHGLGRRAMVKAVWESDRRLAEVSNSFDFLMQVSPANGQHAWRQFRKSDYRTPPVFRYTPLLVDPLLLKRKLFSVRLERLEDPAIRQLLRQKLDELDRRLTMLSDIDTPKFLHASLQLYGELDPKLVSLAEHILDVVPSRTREESKGGTLTPVEFAALAETEMEAYRSVYPQMTASVQLRDDIPGLMVSRGRLLVSRHSKIPVSRANALIQHEVGTHIVTYFNGKAQSFRQLYSGLAGYDSLQEGLAVFAEYLVGGLTRRRIRLLAARVHAVRRVVEGADFMETFTELDRTYDFDRKTAFGITVRVFRGGGLTKDAVYLQGLVDLLAYLKDGGKIEPLLVGKMALEHIPLIEELLWRQVLKPPPLRPRYLDFPEAAERLDRARAGMSVLDLVTPPLEDR